MRTMKNLLVKKAVVTVLAVGVSLAAVNAFWGGSDSALSQLGSSGSEVRAIQERLKERGLFNDSVTGYYGEKTKAAVIKFQKQQGISQTGTAGPQTLRALGISIGSVPSATEQNINLLARIISAEARGEPYVGQVAVGAVILNRIEHPSFPDTLSGVIYQNGAFTAIVDGQFNEPIADTARGILDGHIVLSRSMAQRNHYPAIDVLASISRVMSVVASKEHKKLAGKMKNILAVYRDAEDLINIGAYRPGSNKEIDFAIEKIDAVNEFLRQGTDEKFLFDDIIQMMRDIFEEDSVEEG